MERSKIIEVFNLVTSNGNREMTEKQFVRAVEEIQHDHNSTLNKESDVTFEEICDASDNPGLMSFFEHQRILKGAIAMINKLEMQISKLKPTQENYQKLK